MDFLRRVNKDKIKKDVEQREKELGIDKYGTSPIEHARKHILRQKHYEEQVRKSKSERLSGL